MKKEDTPKANPNLVIWEASEKPPEKALKPIKGGRMSGMTDINPQWRIKKLTELFGACGKGWWTEETRREFVPCGDEVAVFIDINLYVGGHEKPIHGTGGSMFRQKERDGLRCNDEAVKMASTDAMSVCCKHLGIGSAIYEGRWDGSKYKDEEPETTKTEQTEGKKASKPADKKPETAKTEQPSGGDIKWYQLMTECKKALGEEEYRRILGVHGYTSSKDIKDRAKRKACYDQMTQQIKANADWELNGDAE